MIFLDLQFRKDLISYLRTIANETDSREQTQEVRLPDGMPDIGHVLASYGQVLIRGKEWRSSGVGVNGGVMVWVLYAPEDGSGLQCVEAWIPFQMKWELDTMASDGVIYICPMLESVDARSIAARKLMVRACVGVTMQAKRTEQAEIYLPDKLPEDICILQNTYPMQLPVEGGEKAFSMEEMLTPPGSVPQIEKILYYDLSVSSAEQRILADKLVFRGMAQLDITYLDTMGKVGKWNCEIPFSQYAELKEDRSDHAQSRMIFAVTNLELEKTGDGQLVLKAGLLGQYVVCDQNEIPVVEDAYSPRRSVLLQKVPVRLPALLDSVEDTIYAQQSGETVDGDWVDLTFYPAIPRIYHDSDGISGALFGTFSVLYEDEQGHLQGIAKPWEGTWELPSDPDIETELTLSCGNVSMNGDLSAELKLEGMLFADRDISAVAGLDVGEPEEPNPDRPSLILRRMGEQSLWEVAKSAGSTVEAILKANNLTKPPEEDKMLLIPIQ